MGAPADSEGAESTFGPAALGAAEKLGPICPANHAPADAEPNRRIASLRVIICVVVAFPVAVGFEARRCRRFEREIGSRPSGILCARQIQARGRSHAGDAHGALAYQLSFPLSIIEPRSAKISEPPNGNYSAQCCSLFQAEPHDGHQYVVFPYKRFNRRGTGESGCAGG